jgi:hypothetical protein
MNFNTVYNKFVITKKINNLLDGGKGLLKNSFQINTKTGDIRKIPEICVNTPNTYKHYDSTQNK